MALIDPEGFHKFDEALDKHFIDKLEQNMRNTAKPDARCSIKVSYHRQRMPSGGIMVCTSCQGTDREPIPTREVIQHE